ncbi:MAG: hypothetical protein ACHQUC_03350 [Chlamydiales bacterium]
MMVQVLSPNPEATNGFHATNTQTTKPDSLDDKKVESPKDSQAAVTKAASERFTVTTLSSSLQPSTGLSEKAEFIEIVSQSEHMAHLTAKKARQAAEAQFDAFY